jgi:hypothetical protein
MGAVPPSPHDSPFASARLIVRGVRCRVLRDRRSGVVTHRLRTTAELVCTSRAPVVTSEQRRRERT